MVPMCAPTSGPDHGGMETSWNTTQQLVDDRRNALHSVARDQRLLKRARRNKKARRRTYRIAVGRASDPSPSVYLPPTAVGASAGTMQAMLVGRPGLSPVMVGRAAEIERLVHLVESGPPPAIALLGGEAGVGKTRLVRELIARLPQGTVVRAGQ